MAEICCQEAKSTPATVATVSASAAAAAVASSVMDRRRRRLEMKRFRLASDLEESAAEYARVTFAVGDEAEAGHTLATKTTPRSVRQLQSHHNGSESMERPAPETEVTLREFTEVDAEALFSWASDTRFVLFQRREAYARVDEAWRYILDHVLPHPWYRAICVGGAVVGSISVKLDPAEERGEGRRSSRAFMGYRIAHGYWGRGIATRAVGMAAEAAFAEWPWLVRLEETRLFARSGRAASERPLRRFGVLTVLSLSLFLAVFCGFFC